MTSQTQDPNLPAPRSKVSTIRDLLAKKKDLIAQALPRHMTPERLMRVAMTSIQTTPMLMECTEASLVMSIIKAAEMGLEIGGGMNHAYLVPFRDKKSGTVQAQLIPGYQGLIELARRSGIVLDIYAHVVHANDTFEVEYGLVQRLVHKPAMVGERGAPVAAYCVVKLKEADPHFEVMTAAEIGAIRARSKAANNGPWVTDTMEMWRKTVIRRTLKYIPKSIELADAITLSDQEYRIEDVIDVDTPVDQQLGADGLRARLEAAKPQEGNGQAEGAPAQEATAGAQEPAETTPAEGIIEAIRAADTPEAMEAACRSWTKAERAGHLTTEEQERIMQIHSAKTGGE